MRGAGSILDACSNAFSREVAGEALKLLATAILVLFMKSLVSMLLPDMMVQTGAVI